MTTQQFHNTDIDQLIGAAAQAPSSHNTQPWLFRVGPSTIDLIADRTRALPVNDPFDRELTISCGAALRNLEVAARHHRLEPTTTVLPDSGDPDLLATVTLSPTSDQPDDDLYDAIGLRRTTRGDFANSAPSELVRNVMAHAFRQGVRIEHVPADARDDVAELIAEGDRRQFADPRWRRELASWMHPRRRGDGLVVPEVIGLATRAVVTAINLGKSTAAADYDKAIDAADLIVMTSSSDDPRAWLAVGQSLQQLLLKAARSGVQAGYLNQPCQVQDLRIALQQALGTAAFPQLIVRLGTPTEAPKRTPRRAIADLVVMD